MSKSDYENVDWSLTDGEIAKLLGKSKRVVNKKRHRLGIKIPKKSIYLNQDKINWTLSVKTLSEKYGCSETTIYKLRNKLGINWRKPQIKSSRKKVTPDQINKVDWTQNNSSIARFLGISVSTVSRLRAKYNKTHLLSETRGGHSKKINIDFEYKLNKRGRATITWSDAVRRYYGQICLNCGYHRPPVTNHAHHIIPLSKNGPNTVRNATVLCSRCHDEVHAGLLKL